MRGGGEKEGEEEGERRGRRGGRSRKAKNDRKPMRMWEW